MEAGMDSEMMMDGQRPYEEEEYCPPARRARGVEPYYPQNSLRAELIDLKNRVLMFLGCVSLGLITWALIAFLWVRVLAILGVCLLLLLGLAWAVIAFLQWI